MFMKLLCELDRVLFLCENSEIPAAVIVTFTGHELSYSFGMNPEQMAPHASSCQ